MNLWLRLLTVLAMALFRRNLALDEESVLTFRVWPTDLDFNIHMTNSRYFALMDLGRIDVILRNGMGRLAFSRRLQPVVGSAMVRFRRPLRPFERFTLRSRILGWNDKWLYFEQKLERGNDLACRAIFKAAFLDQGVPVPSQELADAVGHTQPSAPLPQWVTDWLAAEAAQHQPVIAPVEEARCAR